MQIDMEHLLESMLSSISEFKHLESEKIPNIDLYVDQVTTFMEEELSSCKRYEDDKIMTKTMINNYAKNNLLPPPLKKKYSKEHVLVMTFIYYFKSILSIKDIETVLAPVTSAYFQSGDTLDIETIYNEVCEASLERTDDLKKDIQNIYTLSQKAFSDTPGLSDNDKGYLQIFSLLCSLCFDVYMKKALIEQIIDQLPEPESHKKKK